MFETIALIYVLVSIFVSAIALKLNRTFFDFLVISLIFTPITGGIILALLGKLNK
jgi:small neutral amino acid transporter SnatA (MarC family)